MSTRSLLPVGYLVVGGAGCGVAALFRLNPFVLADPWLGTHGLPAILLSAGLGTVIGATTVAATRTLVRRASWARALHADLRPVVKNAGSFALALSALFGGLAEEIIFRGILVPWIGVILSSIAFALLHQVRGPSRWPWMAWAALMGLLFAVVFRATGSLVGPLVAHVWVNLQNLRFLRDTDVEPRRTRRLGGILGR